MALSAMAMVCASGIGYSGSILAHEGLPPGHGHLFLVSAGTGDLDNMTIRAHKTLSDAEIIFTMHPERAKERYGKLLEEKEIYEAGHGLFWEARFSEKKQPGVSSQANQKNDKKRKSNRSPEKQRELEKQARKVIREAVSEGKSVAIICNGDPLIYGPHTGYLKEFQDLRPIVIPGISSFNAASAALQRGLTGGDSRAVILTSARSFDHERKEHLKALADTHSTMVFFMNRDLPGLIATLKESYSGQTPIALVANAGSRKEQQVIKGTLDTILEIMDGKRLGFAHLVYVGDFLK